MIAAAPDHVGNPCLVSRDPGEGFDERLSVEDPGAGDLDERFTGHGSEDLAADNLLDGIAYGGREDPHPTLPRKRGRES